jgi:hypothetical protein
VIVTFVGIEAKTGLAQWKDEYRPFRCVTLQITNNLRENIAGMGFKDAWCYKLVADKPDQGSLYPRVVACGSCGDISGPLGVTPGGRAQICIPPEDLGPGVAVSISYWMEQANIVRSVTFGHSDLPPSIQKAIANAPLSPCRDMDYKPKTGTDENNAPKSK